jgi:hypothetical protein
MELYHKYQPVTWSIGVVEAPPEAISKVIVPLYFPSSELNGIYHHNDDIEIALMQMAPLGLPVKYLLIETIDCRTVLFSNIPSGATELPTWYAMTKLQVPAYCITNRPNTISADRKSGVYGGRKIENRTITNPYNKEPTFGIQVINDAGKWHFYRFGDKLPFENEQAYERFRKMERFTQEMLVQYCTELGIPVYDKKWYSRKWILIQGNTNLKEKGITYQEGNCSV